VSDDGPNQPAIVEFADNVGIAVTYQDSNELFVPWTEVRAVVMTDE
jgi:hypothetical protein